MRSSRRRTCGFVFLDLLGMGATSVVLGAFLVLSLAGERERANRVKCASNLRQIGQVMLLYAGDGKAYPRVRYDPTVGARMNYYTGAKGMDPFGGDGPEPNDVTAAMFLLIRMVDVSPEVLQCPSAEIVREQRAGKPLPRWWDAPGWNAGRASNFPRPGTLDYSMAQPYPDKNALSRGYKWSPNVSAEWAIAADINPGGDELLTMMNDSPRGELRKGNSPNHGTNGQNVLYNDGHVDWFNNPFAGHEQDNIYTRAKCVEKQPGQWTQAKPATSEKAILSGTPKDEQDYDLRFCRRCG